MASLERDSVLNQLPVGMAGQDLLLDTTGAAAFLKVTRRTLENLRSRGGGPLFVHISGRCLRYRRVDLEAWVESRLRHSSSDRGVQS